MNQDARRALDRFADMVAGLGKQSHHTPQEYPKAVRLFMDLAEQGILPHPDEVKHWARDRGWSERNARDLGEMADTVGHVMRELGRLGIR